MPLVGNVGKEKSCVVSKRISSIEMLVPVMIHECPSDEVMISVSTIHCSHSSFGWHCL
jgi:hypothetical protein